MAKEVYACGHAKLTLDLIREDPCGWIFDYIDDEEYSYLNRIYSVLIEDCPLAEFNKEYECNKTLDELRDEYKREFPPMLGRVFMRIGRAIVDEDLKLNIKIEESN